MLDLHINPHCSVQDKWLEQAAKKMNDYDIYGRVSQEIFFGEEDTRSCSIITWYMARLNRF